MLKQMAWLPSGEGDSTKILYLRTDSTQPWQPYSAFPEYSVADYDIDIEGASQGFATFQKLLREGWSLVSSNQIQQLPRFNDEG